MLYHIYMCISHIMQSFHQSQISCWRSETQYFLCKTLWNVMAGFLSVVLKLRRQCCHAVTDLIGFHLSHRRSQEMWMLTAWCTTSYFIPWEPGSFALSPWSGIQVEKLAWELKSTDAPIVSTHTNYRHWCVFESGIIHTVSGCWHWECNLNHFKVISVV